MMKNGQHIVVGGLGIQILFFGLFIVVALTFHARMRKLPTQRVSLEYLPWQRHLYVLYSSSALIMIRSIFRVVEFVQGNDGYLFSHEWFMWVFDALLMLFVMVLFSWIHPGEISDCLNRTKQSDPESRSSGTPVQMESFSRRDVAVEASTSTGLIEEEMKIASSGVVALRSVD